MNATAELISALTGRRQQVFDAELFCIEKGLAFTPEGERAFDPVSKSPTKQGRDIINRMKVERAQRVGNNSRIASAQARAWGLTL